MAEKKKKPGTVAGGYTDYRSRQKDLDAAGDLTSKSPEEVEIQTAIDNVFKDVEAPENPTSGSVIMDYINSLFDTSKKTN
jgi:hypothetical protein